MAHHIVRADTGEIVLLGVLPTARVREGESLVEGPAGMVPGVFFYDAQTSQFVERSDDALANLRMAQVVLAQQQAQESAAARERLLSLVGALEPDLREAFEILIRLSGI